MFYKEPYKNALDLQRLIISAANSTETTKRELSALSRAFCELEWLKRCIAGKPNPRPIDVTKALKPARVRQLKAAFEEPAGPPGPTTGSVQPESPK